MENVIEVQKQIKDNAMEVNDFLKDLDSWAAEMKVKDNQLREQKLKRMSGAGKENSSPSPGKQAATSPGSSRTSGNSSEEANSSAPINIPAKQKETVNITMKHKQVEEEKKNSTKKTKDRGKDEVPSPPKKERIKAYEYDKWDKFDVEEECSKLDADKNESDCSSEGSEEDEMETARLKQQAVAERERGNTWFKQAKYDKAIERYTAGIQIDPYCPLLPANRAMAFLKIKKYGAAEQDCSLSLSLDPTYIKALQRRVAARTGLSKYNEALMDCEKILQLDPGNKLATSDKQHIQSKIAEVESKKLEDDKNKTEDEVKEEVKDKIEKLNLKDNMKVMFKPVKERPPVERLEPTSDVSPGLLLDTPGGQEQPPRRRLEEDRPPWSSPDSSLMVHPVKKQPHQSSKKPLQRITIHDKEPSRTEAKEARRGFRMPILEVDGGDAEMTSPDTSSPPASLARPPSPKEIPDNERFVELPVTPVKSVKKPAVEPTKPAEALKTDLGDDDEVMEVEETTSSEIGEKPPAVKSDGFSSKSQGFVRQVEKDINTELEKSCQSDELRPESEVPPVPKTSAQFSKDWRNLKSVESRLSYLCQLDKDLYPAVFKSQMESRLFSEILSVLGQANISSKVAADQLIGLSMLPRMSALSMFLTSAEQRTLASVLEVARDSLSEQGLELVKRVMSV